MSIQDKINESGFDVALKSDVKALDGKQGLGPGWGPYASDVLVDYVIALEKRVADLEALAVK